MLNRLTDRISTGVNQLRNFYNQQEQEHPGRVALAQGALGVLMLAGATAGVYAAYRHAVPPDTNIIEFVVDTIFDTSSKTIGMPNAATSAPSPAALEVQQLNT